MMFCCIALFVLGGGHWAALQSVAWVRMIADYSKDRDVSTALEMTFDGQNPCDMCKEISKGKSQEKKNETVKSEKKVEFVAAPLAAECFLLDHRCWLIASAEYAEPVALVPPTPPPKVSQT